jgi:hypothetical protein
MQHQMMTDGRSVNHTPRELFLIAFWVVALVGFGFLIGVARGSDPAETERVLPAQTTIEDWHGNVRRSG